MKRLLFIFLLSFSCLVAGQQLNFQKYSLEEGLSRSGVYCILHDRSGFLWIGTEGGGVCKFDGKTFTNYTRHHGLASNEVQTIFQDDNGVLWFGTPDGISYYENKEFTTLTIEDGLTDNYIRGISQDTDGIIWVGTDLGITFLDPNDKVISEQKNFVWPLPDIKVRCMLAQNDIMWIGTDQGLCKFQNYHLNIIRVEDGLSSDRVLTMHADKAGKLWLGTQEGLNCLDGDSIYKWTLMDGLLHNRVRSITEDNHGDIWIGTSEGISIFNGKRFKHLAGQKGLDNARVRCLMKDSFENIWIGTYFGGMIKFNHQDFISYSSYDGLVSSQILTISQDPNRQILVGTYEGVSKMYFGKSQLDSVKTIDLNNGFWSNSVSAIYADKLGRQWYGTSLGITVIDGDSTFQIGRNEGLQSSQVTCIKGFQSNIYIGTKLGVAIINDTSNVKNLRMKFLTVEDGFAGKEVSNIIEDSKGRVWISFLDGQISFIENDIIINPEVPDLANEIISLSMNEQDELWMGTNGNGVFYGNYLAAENRLSLENISSGEGLLSNSIYSLLSIDTQHWVGHENGISLITWINDTAYTVKTFGPESGFYGLQNNANASFKDASGNLWFGTVNGLFCLKAHEISHIINGIPSIPYITTVKIGGEKMEWESSEWCQGTEGQYSLPKNLKLPYDQNNISFEFIGLNFIHPKNIKYTWKLEGFDEAWSPASGNNFTSYTNLSPGNYSFVLKSSDEHGFISGDEIRFSFEIEKPFWSTWFFRIFAGIFAGFLIWLITRMRTKQLIKQKNTLENIIFERTKEIQSQADELAIKNKEVTDSIKYSKRIQGSILPGKEKLKLLLSKYFIFYKPKDIVSGDFYWVEQSRVNPNLTFFAAADCTGHGVPGAMVSLIGTRALGTAVHEAKLVNTNEILDHTTKIMVEAFTDAESGEIIKDGMDISICSLDYTDPAKVKFQFSGAQNPIWIVRKKSDKKLSLNEVEINVDLELDDYMLYEIKGDKQPIGYFEGAKPFTSSEGILNKGDRIFLLTDGYADQFGGDKGKKFKYKTLKELILSAQETEINKQRDIYKSAFLEWKRDIEQVDDVCLIGVEV